MHRRLANKSTALAAIRDLLSSEPELAEEASILDLDEVEPEAMPEPYRGLLCHDGDMTHVLQDLAGQTIHVRPLHVERSGEDLDRRVLLIGDDDGRTVEFGAIRIHLQAFDEDAREEILASRAPLGAILKRHAVPFRCWPRLFFRLRGSAFLRDAFEMDVERALYGRVNAITGEDGQALADVVEVLPPLIVPTP